MLTGDLRNQIDRLWDSFWSGGISNPLEVIEQITYLLFLRRLDELQQLEENKANRLGGTAFRLWAMKVATPTSLRGAEAEGCWRSVLPRCCAFRIWPRREPRACPPSKLPRQSRVERRARGTGARTQGTLARQAGWRTYTEDTASRSRLDKRRRRRTLGATLELLGRIRHPHALSIQAL